MAEVPFTAALGAGLVEGKLDRLQVAPDCVRLVDFKSNAVVPPNAEMVPEGLLRQMGAYAAAFGQIYPDRRIETFILWTRTATLMPLDADIVSAALLRATIP
jgi:ATP-dependent helicase/nuclease subunit A